MLYILWLQDYFDSLRWQTYLFAVHVSLQMNPANSLTSCLWVVCGRKMKRRKLQSEWQAICFSRTVGVSVGISVALATAIAAVATAVDTTTVDAATTTADDAVDADITLDVELHWPFTLPLV